MPFGREPVTENSKIGTWTLSPCRNSEIDFYGNPNNSVEYGVVATGWFMMEAYKSWVRHNRQWISICESLANTMTWFLPERFANSELTLETVSTLLGVLTVMNQHIIETAPRSQSRTLVLDQVTAPEPEQHNSFPWSLCISVMKEVEVLTEMTAEHYLSKDKKWGPVASIEAIKVLLRLIILQRSGYKMLLDGGESKNDVDPARSHTVLEGPNRGPSQGQDAVIRPLPKQPVPQRRAGRDGPNPSLYPRDLEGRAMQAMHRFSENMAGPSKPSWLRYQQSAQVESRAQELLPYNPSPVSLVPRECNPSRASIAGEVLLISRPLLYVLLVWRYGLKSWKPWLSSLWIDLAGMYLTSSSISTSQRSIGLVNGQHSLPISVSTQEVQELRKRQLRWALYAMRNPFFDRYTRHPLEMVEQMLSPVPIVGMLAGKAIELLLAVQGLHSYTAAS